MKTIFERIGARLLAPKEALVVMMVQYISAATFQSFTQSLDAIDITCVTLSHLNIINAMSQDAD